MSFASTLNKWKKVIEEDVTTNITNFQLSFAANVDKVLNSMGDSTEKDRLLRKHLSTYAPTPIPGFEWSLINAVDYNFDGFSGQHLCDYSILRGLPNIQHESLQVPTLLVVQNMSLASKLSYEDSALIDYVCQKWNMKTSAQINFNFKDIRAFIMHDSNNIVLCFRGTEIINPKDWSTDVKLKFVPMAAQSLDGANSPSTPTTPTPQVHFGFYNALGLTSTYEGISPYSMVGDEVRQMLIAHPHKKLWITGHSLGGALASVFVAQLVLDNDDDILQHLAGLYTFGQPRCGDIEYKNLFNGLTKQGLVYRIVNKKDVVCTLPLKIANYIHHGNKIRIADRKITLPIGDKSIERTSTITKAALPINSTLKKIMFALLPNILEDHYPSEYVRNVQLFI